jgi:hypothetical protein
MSAVDWAEIDRLTGGRIGSHDVPCPSCGPQKNRATSRNKQTLRIWIVEPDYATWHCARCGDAGWARDGANAGKRPPDSEAVRRAQAEAAERDRAAAAERLDKAKWLWSQRRPIAGTPAERYLREARKINLDQWPATLGYLPGRGDHPHAMIAAFGIAREVEPGIIRIDNDDIRGVHVTRLLPDGSDRERGDRAKIMIGRSAGWPIVLAPPNDLLGMAITEGIEDALSVHVASGLGAWAAGAASRMPALAERVPSYIECVTVVMDPDPAGRRGALGLADALHRRGIEVLIEGQR